MENSRRAIRVVVVIPAYRVEDSIRRVLLEIPSWVNHIIVVDDASPDSTEDAVRAVGDPRIILLRRDHNGGVGKATLSGFKKAVELEADVVIKMDGDGQMDPSYLGQLIEPLITGEADYVKGNRFRDKRVLSEMPKTRLFGNSCLAFLTKAASGYWDIFDPTNGFIAIRGEVLRRLNLDKLHPRYFFEISMLLALSRIRATVVDVPIPARYGDEKSSLSPTTCLLAFPFYLAKGLISRIFWQYFLVDFNAGTLFLTSGMPLLLWGIGFGVHAWVKSFQTGKVTSTGTVMLSVLPLLMGFHLLVQALVIDVWMTPRRALCPPLTRPNGSRVRRNLKVQSTAKASSR